MAFIGVVYPFFVLAYTGEAVYLLKHPVDPQRSFYKAVPESLFWPFFIIATLATVVGSQATITATFSVVNQCRALGCFPRVKIIHTSKNIHGQIYIPEINWLLMLLCLAITIGFRDTNMIGNVYAFLFTISFGSLELIYFAACLGKARHGGWIPLILSLITMFAMSIWHYGTTRKQAFEFQNKVGLEKILSLGPSLGLVHVPGVGLAYTNMMAGVPPMFAHFVTNFPTVHRILIFVSMQTLTIPKVPLDECFLVGRIGSPEHRLFRCIVRHGYKDGRMTSYDFENQMLMKVAEFLQQEGAGALVTGEMSMIGKPSDMVVHAVTRDDGDSEERKSEVQFRGVVVREEVRELLEQRDVGVAYMMGHTYVVARDASPVIKKLVLEVYGFIRCNCRQPSVTLGIPHTSLIEVSMVYHV